MSWGVFWGEKNTKNCYFSILRFCSLFLLVVENHKSNEIMKTKIPNLLEKYAIYGKIYDRI